MWMKFATLGMPDHGFAATFFVARVVRRQNDPNTEKMYECMYVCMTLYIYVCMYVCMCVCMYVYIYIYFCVGERFKKGQISNLLGFRYLVPLGFRFHYFGFQICRGRQARCMAVANEFPCS